MPPRRRTYGGKVRLVLSWVLPRASLYLFLVAALMLGPLVVDLLRSGSVRGELMSPRELSSQIERLRGETAVAVGVRVGEISRYSLVQVDARLSQARSELVEIERQLRIKQGWFASIRPRAILERKQLELRRTALMGEIRLLQAAREGQLTQVQMGRVMVPTPAALAASARRCGTARAEARRFDARNAVDRTVRNVLTAEARRLRETVERRCEEHRARFEARERALERVQQLRERLRREQAAYTAAGAQAQHAIRTLPTDFHRTVRVILFQAAVLLVGIIATPYLVRIFFYFVLAPLAERRPSVRLPWPEGYAAAAFASAGSSGTSVAITLGGGDELLVRQGFLQSTSIAGAKSTRALLDWRHPFSSLASGLAFLTRIGGDGAMATVSAVRDPLAEVAMLNLSPAAACVLQPRALVGVVQPVGRPVRITSHWRLGSLHAWLTLQLRYLVFHGPAQLVVKGGRGVRVEPVVHGQVFGQDQLVGFSAELAYSVVRTETFWPYFFGLEQLLKDRVEAGAGLLVLEEAPSAAAARTRRRGVEGAADAILKLVGL